MAADSWIEIAVAVVAQGDQFLVGVRDSQATLAGKAEFPGGKIEPGETPHEAAVRECQEETGLVVRAEGLMQVHVERYDHGTVRLHFIDCCLPHPDGSDLPSALPPWRWTHRASLASLDFPRGNRLLIEELSAMGGQTTGGHSASRGADA